MNWTWTDVLIHLLAYPIYQIIGTIRHEGSHALAAMSCGASILEFRFLPHRREGKFFWGYVSWSSGLDLEQMRLVYLAPYLVDVFLLITGSVVLRMHQFENFHWLAFAVIMLLLSPAIDTLYNLGKWAVKGTGDFADARRLRDS
jgi:hypothetical protein